MIQFLKGLWKVFKQSAPDNKETVVVSSDERVARFIYHKGDWSKQPIPKPKTKVFMPEKYEGQWETSVCGLAATSEQRIWEIANQTRSPLKALARADLIVSAIEEVGLRTVSAPDLKKNYPEHAVIVGWPDEKEKQMALSIQLISSASLVLAS